MANGLLCYDPTPFTASAVDFAVDHPPSNVGIGLRVMRTWRSTTAAASRWWQADFGAAVTLGALLIDNVNFSSAIVQVSDDPTFASFTNYGTPTIDPDPHLRDPVFWRRKALIIPASPVAKRYLRLTTSSIVGGAGYAELGRVLAFSTANVETLKRNPTQWSFTRRRPQTVLEYAGHGFDRNKDGVVNIECDLSADPAWIHDGVLPQLERAFASDLFVLYTNRSVLTEAYAFAPPSELSSRESFRQVVASMVLRECV